MSVAVAGPYDGSGPQPLFASGRAPELARRVGDRARLRALATWCAASGIRHDTLRAVDTDFVRLDPATASRLADQLRRVSQVLRVVELPCLAWAPTGSDVIAGGVFGVLLSQEPGLPVLTRNVAVSAVLGEAGGELVVRSLEGAQEWRVKSWTAAGALSADGGALDLPVEVGAVFRAALGESGHVFAAAATSVVSGLLVGLAELAHECASSATVLLVSSGAAPAARSHLTAVP